MQEGSAAIDIHVHWDTPDLDAAMDAAFFTPRPWFGNLGWITKPF